MLGVRRLLPLKDFKIQMQWQVGGASSGEPVIYGWHRGAPPSIVLTAPARARWEHQILQSFHR